MKRYFLASIGLMMMISAFAQSKAKPKDQAPTQKEIAAMMKEMQKEIDAVSPEERRMMDSMGMKLPDIKSVQKNLSGVSNTQLKQAFDDENRIVPLKDLNRISSISILTLPDAAIPAFLQSAHKRLAAHLHTTTIENGEKIYQWLKNKYNDPTATGNAAIGLWMMGKLTVALYLLSKACQDDPADADNLNNFSALLSMSGGEQLALPLLNNLNKKFPGNSTLLNNIGQAWFGLGDINKAEKYFDSTIRIYTHHSQANLTQSLIHESKGEKSRAVEAVKRSIKEAYSMEKADRLNKLDHKLKSDDLNWDQPMPKDALGLERFNWPDYPKNVERSSLLEKEWEAFKESCENEIENLKQQEESLQKVLEEAGKQRHQELLQAGIHGSMVDPVPRFAHKAYVKLAYLIDGKDGQLAHDYQRKLEALAAAYMDAEALDVKLSEDLEQIRKKYEDEFGEGKQNPFDKDCNDKNGARNSFLNQANTQLQAAFVDYAGFMRRMLNDQAYYYQYTMWPEEFEVAKVGIKLSWLQTIKNQRPQFKQKCVWSGEKKEVEKTKFQLAMFDDIHCNYHSESNLLIGTINSDCAKLSAKLDIYILKNTLGIEVVKLGVKMKQGDRADESVWDQFQTASAELGFKKGVSAGAGPLKVEAKAGIAGRVEVGKHGITDVAIIATGDIKIGTNLIKVLDGTTTIVDHSEGPVKDKSISIIGAEAKISIVSGYTLEAKGILKDLMK